MPNIRIIIIFAVIIIAAIGGLAWPFLANMKLGYVLEPVQASQWHMGKGSEYTPEMIYQISFNQTKFFADMKFLPVSGGNQQLLIKIDPSNVTKEIDQTVNIGLVYDFVDTSAESKSYVDLLDQSIFSMRDYATESKYLSKDAEWGDLYIGENEEKLKVTDSGKMPFKFGSANAFLLSYRIGVNINKVWIIDNLPLPIKSEIYDPYGNLLYTYELVSLKAPSTPGFTS